MTDTTVKIAAPLPLDIAGNILRAIGHLYPCTMISTASDTRWSLTLLIPDTDRVGAEERFDDLPEAEKIDDADSGLAIDYLGFNDDTLTVTTPEEASLALGYWASIMLADPNIANYLEAEVHTKEGAGFVVSAARSKQQTPHALRKAAEARADQHLDTIRTTTERLRDLAQPGRTRDEIVAALTDLANTITPPTEKDQ